MHRPNLSRHLLLVLPGLLAALLPACDSEKAVEPAGPAGGGVRPPDVAVVLIDTLRADALSFYGNERETAPYLARLAGESTVFAHAYASSTWTAPSTASLLTGLYPDRHGVVRGFLAQFREEDEAVAEQALQTMELLQISSDAPTLAERFRDLGYDTYGLASNVNIGPEMGFDRGFALFERHDLHPAKFLRERLQEWKREMDASDNPSFTYLHFNDVHKPYELRPKYYRPEEGRDETEELRERYYSELGYLDGFLARIHEDLGWDDDTLLVIAADHGEEFRDHGNLYHDFTLYNELSWIPLLIHAPGLRVRPGVVQENVGIIDVAPTIFDLIGLPVPGDLDGISLAPFCVAGDKETGLGKESAALLDRPLFLHRFENGEELWGIVRERWKLIAAEEGYLLFDLRSDPGELNNLADELWERIGEKLLAELDAHRARDARPQSKRSNVEIDEDLMERLRAIGYVK